MEMYKYRAVKAQGPEESSVLLSVHFLLITLAVYL